MFIHLAVLFEQFLSILCTYYSSSIRMVVCVVHIVVHYYFDICTLLENANISTENNYYKPEENEQCKNF